MKTFTKQEVRDLINKVVMDEVSFTRMVEIMNERVSERVSERVEDIPVRKFKKGEKVRITEGISSKTHDNVGPAFVKEMDDLIGKTMTIDRYTDEDSYVECEGMYWSFLEEWLEPYEELKDGDLAIFWEFDKTRAVVRLFDNEHSDVSFYVDNTGYWWYNAIKFESKEQYERLIRGEI